jgi:hypothetical protein
VGYRARRLPFWLGRLGVEKWRLGEEFARRAGASGLRLDINVEEAGRLYGVQWRRFLESCRTVLGSESGASVFDFTGGLQASVEAYLERRPDVSFEEVESRFLLEHEGRVRLNQISPRCFEAAALRTGMVLLEGGYSAILIPNRHYISLKKDFGNLQEVVGKIRDTAAVQQMVERTHEEIARNPAYSYRSFVAHFDNVVEEEIAARSTRPANAPAVFPVAYPAIGAAYLLGAWARAGVSALLPSGAKQLIRSLAARTR